MSVNEFGFKIGDSIEVLYYEEGGCDAPSDCIAKFGKIVKEEVAQKPYIWLVEFEEEINDFKGWNFKTEQLKLVETN